MRYAENFHSGQFRQSGEPYITHPLNVAIILSEQHLDKDTICAGLLHDVIEENEDITKEDIANDFNSDVATLLDGVTKILEEFQIKLEEESKHCLQEMLGTISDVLTNKIFLMISKLELKIIMEFIKD